MSAIAIWGVDDSGAGASVSDVSSVLWISCSRSPGILTTQEYRRHDSGRKVERALRDRNQHHAESLRPEPRPPPILV